MEKLVVLVSFSFFLGGFCTLNAQEFVDERPANYKKRHAIYDYSNALTATDSISGFASKATPLKLTGTVFLSDGVTPAKDVILFINQTDENGDYELKKHLQKRYVNHRAWIKTDADGRYTFYTFIPGKDRYSKALKRIHLVIKEPQGIEYNGHDFLFDNDPRLTKLSRKKLAKIGVDSILKPEKQDNMLVATKNIILNTHRVELAKK